MRIIAQNVTDARLFISERIVAEIGKGFVLLVGFTNGDSETIVSKMADKILKMRVFQDENGKTNKSLSDIQGELLVVPQFTLYADLSGGRRPSFTSALAPTEANQLFAYFLDELKKTFPHLKCGVFQSDMQINLTNDGPFTLILDSKELVK